MNIYIYINIPVYVSKYACVRNIQCINTRARSFCLQALWAVAIFQDLGLTYHWGTHPQEHRRAESQRTVRVISSNMLQFHVVIPSYKSVVFLRNVCTFCPDCSHWKTISKPHWELVAKIPPLISWQNFFIEQFMLIFLLCQFFSLAFTVLSFPFAYSFHFLIIGKRDPISAFNLLS